MQLRILSPRSSEGLQVCGGKLVHGQDNRKDSSTFWLQEGRNTKCVGVEEARAKLHRVQTGSLLKLSVYSAETGPQSAKELTIDGNEAYKYECPMPKQMSSWYSLECQLGTCLCMTNIMLVLLVWRRLIVPRNGSAMLMAASPLGIAHGFKTLAQLLTLSADDNKDMPEVISPNILTRFSSRPQRLGHQIFQAPHAPEPHHSVLFASRTKMLKTAQ